MIINLPNYHCYYVLARRATEADLQTARLKRLLEIVRRRGLLGGTRSPRQDDPDGI
jgi:hypothetical protein